MNKETFAELNNKTSRDENFNDFYRQRRDLGDILIALCKCSGSESILNFYNGQLTQCIAKG
jgi:hypothetical protein